VTHINNNLTSAISFSQLVYRWDSPG